MLSNFFSAAFTDIDDTAEEIYFNETCERLSSREIYKRGGRELFMSFELKASKLITLRTAEAPQIAAAGGGICDNLPAIEILKKNFIIFYIDEDADILYDRIIRKGIPAFLSAGKPYDDFMKLYDKRSTNYEKLCNIRISGGGRSTKAIAGEIITKLREDGYAG